MTKESEDKTLYLTVRGTMTVPFANEVLAGVKQKLLTKPKPQELYMSIDSPGGDTDGGIKLYNELPKLGVKLIAHNIGVVDSATIAVFLAGEDRYAELESSFRFHAVSILFNKGYLADKYTLQSKLDEIEAKTETLKDIYRKRLNSKLSEGVLSNFFDFDTRVGFDRALELGILTGNGRQNTPRGARSESWVISNN